MCSIVASFDKDVFKQLIIHNGSRGSFSHSLTTIDPGNGVDRNSVRQWGSFDFTLLDSVPDNHYMIAHCQAPTGGLVHDLNRVHPYEADILKLWHNGIITPESMRYINALLGTEYQWDTQAIGELITQKGFNSLNPIKGSFACIALYDGHPYIFRNQIAPLHIDHDLNISSTPWAGLQSIPFNEVMYLDLEIRTAVTMTKINNLYSPFFFDD